MINPNYRESNIINIISKTRDLRMLLIDNYCDKCDALKKTTYRRGMAQEQNNTTKICTDYHLEYAILIEGVCRTHTHTIVKLSTHTSKTLAHFTVRPPTYTKQLKPCTHKKNLEPLQQNVIYLFFFTLLPFHPSFFHPLRRPETSRDP